LRRDPGIRLAHSPDESVYFIRRNIAEDYGKTGKNDSGLLSSPGMRELSNHRPDQAIASLRQAVDSIPPSCSDELSQALYWLSVALLRLDERPLAIKSLASAQKLRRRGYARRLYLRSVNETACQAGRFRLDDFYAFTNLQIAYYLAESPKAASIPSRKRMPFSGLSSMPGSSFPRRIGFPASTPAKNSISSGKPRFSIPASDYQVPAQPPAA
jgi:tetratricopeptide (TPR) repeat protein